MINQEKAIEIGIKNIQHGVVFDLVVEMRHNSFELQDITSLLPLLNIQEDTLGKYLREMETMGILTTIKTKKKYTVSLTELGKKYIENTEKNQDTNFGESEEKLIDMICGKIAQEIFLISKIDNVNIAKYREELNKIIDKLFDIGTYAIFIAKQANFYQHKCMSTYPKTNKYANVLQNMYISAVIGKIYSNLYKVCLNAMLDAAETDGTFNDIVKIMNMFFIEKYSDEII